MALLYARQGGEFLVNGSIPNSQRKPETVALAGGGFLVVWQDSSGLGGDPSLTSIKGQRYDGAGQPVGSEFLINTSTNNGQNSPDVIATANGGFLVVWQDLSGSSGDFDGAIRGQFFDSSGAKSGSEIRLNADIAYDQAAPSITMLADGGFAVSWLTTRPSSPPDSYHTQAYDSNGTPRGAETVIVTDQTTASAAPAITGLAGGGYVVVWESGQYLYCRVFNADGDATGAAFKLTSSVYGAEQQPALIAMADGGFVAVWSHWADANRNDVLAQRFNAAGQPIGDSFMVTESAAGQQFQPAIAAVPGGYIITWQAGLTGGIFPQTWEIRGQLYDTNFTRSGKEFQVNTQTEGQQTDSAVTVLADGKIVVTWEGIDGSAEGIKAQILVPSSAPTDISISVASVVETAVENLPFATVSAAGAVNSDLTFTYRGDSLGGAFRLEGNQLIVNDSGRLDAEVASSVGVWINVTDANGHSYNEVVVLQVADSNRETRYSAGPELDVSAPTAETAHLANGGFIHLKANGEAAIDLYDAAGVLVRANILPIHTGQEITPTAAGLAGGGFVVTWATPAGTGDGNMLGVQAQLFDSAGNVISGAIPVNATTVGDQDSPSVAALANGGFIVTWRDQSGQGLGPSTSEIKAQLFDAAGNKVGGEFQVNPPDSSYQDRPDVASLSSGGFVITWSDSAGLVDVKAQVFDSAGTKIGGPVTVNTTIVDQQFDQRVTGLVNGGFAVTWEDRSQTGGDTSLSATRAQVFDNLGNKVGGEILVNTKTAGNQAFANIDAMPDGGFVIAWHDSVPTSDPFAIAPTATRMQFFDASGNRSGPEFAGNLSAAYYQRPALLALNSGDLFIAWQDINSGKARFLDLEHPVVANNASNSTPEDSFVHGNLLQNDSAQPGATLRVGAVNGQASNLGETITLPSGATVQVNSNGNYTYVANGAFNYLVGASGAANHSATDSFTYTLTNGTTATATITVTGVGNAGDRPAGTAGNDVIVGTDAAELFDLDQGGVDNVQGNGGNDAFYFGATLTSADIANGGAGLDTLILQGNYSGGVTIGSGVTDIEALSFFAGSNTSFGDPGTNLYSYVINTSDSNFAAGVQVKVNAAPLLVGENFTFNGSAETNASFLIYGGKGVDTLTGGFGNDTFFFADGDRLAPGDTINGGGGGYDGLFLRGNYVIDFSVPGYSNLLTSIENITVTSITDERYARGGGTEFDYNIKFGDAQVPAGGVLTVSGAILQANETLVVDGSLETNGAFRLFGGASNDTLRGGAGDDLIEGLGPQLAGGWRHAPSVKVRPRNRRSRQRQILVRRGETSTSARSTRIRRLRSTTPFTGSAATPSPADPAPASSGARRSATSGRSRATPTATESPTSS